MEPLIRNFYLLFVFQTYVTIQNSVLVRAHSKEIRNILLIIVDDLRPELGIYTPFNDALYPGILTPNIDSLAQNSVVFTSAYTQMALCSPSRTAFMTGRRPDTTRVFENDGYWRHKGGNFTTMPQYFKENGYVSYAAGKIYHQDSEIDNDNDYSWSEKNFKPNTKSYWHANDTSWLIAEPEIYEEIPLPDMQTLDYALSKIEEVAKGDDPFFLAVGFEKPHLPFLAPRHFFELYSMDDIKLPKIRYVPENYPEIAWSGWGDLQGYSDIEEYDNSFNNTLPNYVTKELRLAHCAAVSYTDSLVGKVLDKLRSEGLEDSTAVLFFSDHGFHLGEHAEWAKHTNLQLDSWIPMMVKVPGLTDQGKFIDVLVENVDVFATVVDIVGLPPTELCPDDSSDIPVCTEGFSMYDLLTSDPEDWKSATFTQYQRRHKQIENMGYAVRDHEYLYVRWMTFINETIAWDDVVAEELYDLVNDENQQENVSGYPEFSDVQDEMYNKLKRGWRGALPPEK